MTVVGESGGAASIEAIAATAGVGKQTIYRWWSNRAALIVEALTEYAERRVPSGDTGALVGDLQAFLGATFAQASATDVSGALRAMAVDAQRDQDAADVLRGYAASRRAALTHLFERARARGELTDDIDVPLLVEQAFGVVWYRLLISGERLTRPVGARLARSIATQVTTRRATPAER